MKMNRKMLLLSLPFLAGFLLFYILPLFYSLYYSAIESAFFPKWVGFQNYIAVLQNQYYRLALWNTFEFAWTGVPVLTLVALILSLLFHGMGGKHGWLRGAFVLPMLLPSASVVPIFRHFFTDYNSPVQLAMLGLGMSQSQIVRVPVYLLYVWKNVGFNVILLMAALLMIPRDIYEAAALDGARNFRRFRSITLPLITPTLFFVVLMSIVQSLRIFKEAYLLYGAYPDTSIYMVQHYMNNHFFKLNYQNLTSGGLIFAVIVYLLVLLYYYFERRMDATL